MNNMLICVTPLLISFSCLVAQDPVVNLAQGRIVGVSPNKFSFTIST